MTNSGDAAEQIVRMSLEGTEVALKLTGSAAKNIAAALYAVLKNRDKTKSKGHQRLSAMRCLRQHLPQACYYDRRWRPPQACGHVLQPG